MKTTRLVSALSKVLLAFLFLPGNAPASEDSKTPYPIEDHLVPINFEANADLRSTLKSKLVETPANVACLVIIPPFEPESAITVYSNKKSNSEEFFQVTLTKASASISHAVSAQHIGRTLAPISVTRFDADMPKAAAKSIGTVWRELISRAHQYNYKGEINPPLDYVEYEFSCTGPNGDTIYAGSPYPSEKTRINRSCRH